MNRAAIIQALENELQAIGAILDSYADRELDSYDRGVCAAYQACQNSLLAMLTKATALEAVA